jgi:hypothetical protein
MWEHCPMHLGLRFSNMDFGVYSCISDLIEFFSYGNYDSLILPDLGHVTDPPYWICPLIKNTFVFISLTFMTNCNTSISFSMQELASRLFQNL